MINNEPEEGFWKALGAWLNKSPTPTWPAGEAHAARQSVLRSGLGPLFYAWSAPDPAGELRDAYLHNLARYERWLPEGVKLCGRLEQAGVPCIPMRGPFAGRRYYPDPATRCFTDLDLLVPRASLDKAMDIARDAGYEFRRPLLSSRFYRAAHLHYPLRHAQSGVLCDLHWAVDHPFRHCGIPYDEIFAASTVVQYEDVQWRCMAPEHEMLIACAHARKELEPGTGATGDLLASAFVNRQLFSLLDVALMPGASSSSCNLAPFYAVARRWDLEKDAARVMDAAQWLRQGFGPSSNGVIGATAPSTWVERVGGFRGRRIKDAWTYIQVSGHAPNGERYPWHRRMALSVRSALHLIAGGAVAAGCLLVYRLRSARGGASL